MKKLISKILIIMALAIMTMPLASNAGFQANKGGTSYKTSSSIYANHLFEGIRNMETAGGTLGLNAKLVATTYLEEGEGNGLDCHMAKNTEWGAAAMLSASIYGVAPEGNSALSTTGNDSGIFQMADGSGFGSTAKGYELVAGFLSSASSTYMSTIKNAAPRYYDSYATSTSKPGDATTETATWKKAGASTFPTSPNYPMFCRNYDGGLFGFNDYNGGGISNNGYNLTRYDCSARAVVVCSAGL